MVENIFEAFPLSEEKIRDRNFWLPFSTKMKKLRKVLKEKAEDLEKRIVKLSRAVSQKSLVYGLKDNLDEANRLKDGSPRDYFIDMIVYTQS